MMELAWRRLRADELRERAASDAIVILPVGSLEQHGPHLPVEVDSLLGEAVAMATAEALRAKGEPVVVLPMLWTGISEHHMSFGGTITLEFAAFAALIEGVVRSASRAGFRRIAILNAHGGNENALRTIVDDLTPKLGLPLLQFTYWYAAATEIAALLTRQTALLHACEAETAMTMALRPELVATDRLHLVHGNRAPDLEDLPPPGVHAWRSIASRSPSGVIGHPEAATAEQGRQLIAAIAAALAARLADRALWDMKRA